MFQVKVASIDITPTHPVSLAGFMSRGDKNYASVHDALEINAITINDVTFVSFDTLSVGKVMDDAAKALFGPQTVTLASHTHFAPALDRQLPKLGRVDDAYERHVLGQLEKLNQKMSAQSAVLSFGQGQGHHAVNRRRRAFGSDFAFKMRMLPNKRGRKDETISVLMLQDAQGKVLAVLWSYACHPVSFFDIDAVSSDFCGVVRDGLRRQYGDIPCVFAQGFCGDVRPPAYSPVGNKAVHYLRQLLQGRCFGGFTKNQWRAWAQSLAQRVTSVALAPVSGAVSYKSSVIALNDLQDTQTDRPGLVVSHAGVAGIDIWALSGEPVTGIADLLPASNTRITAGYNGHMFGYLPTSDVLAEGGYEAQGFRDAFSLPGMYRSDISAFLKSAFSVLR